MKKLQEKKGIIDEKLKEVISSSNFYQNVENKGLPTAIVKVEVRKLESITNPPRIPITDNDKYERLKQAINGELKTILADKKFADFVVEQGVPKDCVRVDVAIDLTQKEQINGIRDEEIRSFLLEKATNDLESRVACCCGDPFGYVYC